MSLSSFRTSAAAAAACALLACSPSTTSNSTNPAAPTGATSATTATTATTATGETTGGATAASGATGDGTSPPEVKESDCPPRCSESGAWVGCGLEKPRGKSCGGCVPRCKSKGSAEEGWYDCSGVFIATAKCAS